MPRHPIRQKSSRALALGLLLYSALPAFAIEPATAPSAAAMAEYQRKLEAYEYAWGKFDAESRAFWSAIAEKRRTRISKRRSGQEILLTDYVLTHPPVYAGPPKPVDPSAPEIPPPSRKYVPVVDDFLKAAKEQFNFTPQVPRNEDEYRRAYAKAAAALGLTKEQTVRIYAFECGGNGTYDVQAGLESSRPGAQAITTALGYNQLLSTNTVELLAEQGDRIIKALRSKLVTLGGAERAELAQKVEHLKRMIAFTRTVPDDWSAHARLAETPRGLGVHVLNLDIDIGPLLQTYKLLTSVKFARAKGYTAPLSAAELELMNLTGDGNGFDMLTMPPALRDKVPTANFFHRGGYERNPIAVRNNVVAKLLAAINAAMDREAQLPGAKALASAF
jgi:hypothetical protein